MTKSDFAHRLTAFVCTALFSTVCLVGAVAPWQQGAGTTTGAAAKTAATAAVRPVA